MALIHLMKKILNINFMFANEDFYNMHKITKAIFHIFILCVLFSCAYDEELGLEYCGDVTKVYLTLNSKENTTKTVIKGLDIEWEQGDQLSVFSDGLNSIFAAEESGITFSSDPVSLARSSRATGIVSAFSDTVTVSVEQPKRMALMSLLLVKISPRSPELMSHSS